MCIVLNRFSKERKKGYRGKNKRKEGKDREKKEKIYIYCVLLTFYKHKEEM